MPPASFTRRTSSRPWRCPGGARPALDSSRSAHTRVASDVASHSVVVDEFMPAVPRVATAGAGLLEARARASASPSATSDRCGRVLQVGASQDDDRALGAGVGPLVESAVHGGAAVPGDEDQLDAAQFRQIGPGLGPSSWLGRHGDDGAGSGVVGAEVFGADPAYWPGQRQFWAPEMAAGQPLPGGMVGGPGDGNGAAPELEGVGPEVLGTPG